MRDEKINKKYNKRLTEVYIDNEMQKIEKQLTNTNTNKNSHNFSQTTDDGDNKQNDIDNENKNGSVIIDETEQYEYNSDQGIPAINETKH